jgi:hypothetical protein
MGRVLALAVAGVSNFVARSVAAAPEAAQKLLGDVLRP